MLHWEMARTKRASGTLVQPATGTGIGQVL
jgi:hypothetical protein